MARLTREQKQADTREKLLASARERFARDGYGGASIEAIAENAGYSKGAFYPNFASKEAIFLEVLKKHSHDTLSDLINELDSAVSSQDAIDKVALWADNRARDGNWALLILEYARHAKQDQGFGQEQEEILRSVWGQLGNRLVTLLPSPSAIEDPELLGALVFELAFAPAMSFASRPTAGALVRLALGALVGTADGCPAPLDQLNGAPQARGSH